MPKSRFTLNLALPLLSGLLLSSPAHAAVSWTFNQSNCTFGSAGCNVNSISHANTLNFKSNEVGGPGVTVLAYSSTDDVAGEDQNQSGTLKIYGGGLGITSREDGPLGLSPHHAIDNNGALANNTSSSASEPNDDSGNDFGDIDAVLFEFTQAVSLESAGIGYKSSDADITVLAYTAMGAPTLNGVTPTSLLASGWEVVGSYADLATGTPRVINAAAKVASWWLVSAYNSALGGETGFGYFGAKNDYFKLKTLSAAMEPDASPQNVPAPPAVIMILIGMMMFGIRKRQINA